MSLYLSFLSFSLCFDLSPSSFFSFSFLFLSFPSTPNQPEQTSLVLSAKREFCLPTITKRLLIGGCLILGIFLQNTVGCLPHNIKHPEVTVFLICSYINKPELNHQSERSSSLQVCPVWRSGATYMNKPHKEKKKKHYSLTFAPVLTSASCKQGWLFEIWVEQIFVQCAHFAIVSPHLHHIWYRKAFCHSWTLLPQHPVETAASHF